MPISWPLHATFLLLVILGPWMSVCAALLLITLKLMPPPGRLSTSPFSIILSWISLFPSSHSPILYIFLCIWVLLPVFLSLEWRALENRDWLHLSTPWCVVSSWKYLLVDDWLTANCQAMVLLVGSLWVHTCANEDGGQVAHGQEGKVPGKKGSWSI